MNGARTVEAAVEASVEVAVEAAVEAAAAVTQIGRQPLRPTLLASTTPTTQGAGSFPLRLAMSGFKRLQIPSFNPGFTRVFYTAGTGECGERLPEVNCQPRAMTLALKVSEDNRILQS